MSTPSDFPGGRVPAASVPSPQQATGVSDSAKGEPSLRGTCLDQSPSADLWEVLASKISPPKAATWQIDRPRLTREIDQVTTKSLTIVKAGPGFGKTSLAAAWANRLKSRGIVIWLSLDAEDDEPTRFTFHIAHAFHRAHEALGSTVIKLIADISLVPANTIVSALVNEMVKIDDEIYLFLDDYHWISDARINNAVSLLLKYAPDRFHVILTTRQEPILPIASLRAQDRLAEFDASSLRFDPDEIAAFVDRAELGKLNRPELAILQQRTGGWPALLRILAVTSSQSDESFSRYVQTLSGVSRPIDDYFVEVFDSLPAELFQFMVRVAVLERFCAALCQELTGNPSSGALLESAEVRHLLLVALDQKRRWYRFHPLLSEHLERVLTIRFPEEVPILHRRAAKWFAAHEMWTEAIRHAIAAGDKTQATKWIEKCAMAMVKSGDLLTLLSWQRLFPAALMQNQNSVKVAIAWGMALAMRFSEALEQLVEVEAEIVSGPDEDARALTCECNTIRAVVFALKDDSRQALLMGEPCLRDAPDPWTANVASNIVRWARWMSEDLTASYATPWIPFSFEEERRNVFATVYRLFLQGLLEMQQLRLELADRHFREALRQAERHAGERSVPAAMPACFIAQLLYNQGRFHEAETLVGDRLTIIDATGVIYCAIHAYQVLTRIAVYRKDIEQAYLLLDRAESLAHARQWGRLLAATLLERLRLYLAEGRHLEVDVCLARLKHLKEDHAAPAPCAWSEIHTSEALGRSVVALARNRSHEALKVLSDLKIQKSAGNDPYFALRLDAMISAALLAVNKTAEAETLFCQVLATSKRHAVPQIILDQGPEIGTLLHRFQNNSSQRGVSRDLVTYGDAMVSRWSDLNVAERSLQPASPSVTLSPRERSILELIGDGLSNKEIARDLGITAETVKSHVKHIFIKLDVDRRAQAIVRAQTLGLLGVA